MAKNIRNIALFAHVDAGKTTLTEQFLYQSGKIKKAGSVDKGNSQTDSLEIEKERGITVNSTITTFFKDDVQINLIDTPGHIDFSSETENAIYAIDAAIVIVSAVDGLQAQTENMIDLLQKYQKPFLILINKIDSLGADVDYVIEEIKRERALDLFQFQKIEKEGEESVNIQTIWNKADYIQQQNLVEMLVAENDDLLEQYFSGNMPKWDILNNTLKEMMHQRKIVPVCLASAKKALGIVELLDVIVDYFPLPKQEDKALQAIVFKTYHLKGEGKMAAVRIFSGQISSREFIDNASKSVKEKVSLIKNTDLQNPQIIQSFSAGEIAWVQGLKSASPGDVLGLDFRKINLQEEKVSFLSVQVIPENKADINDLIAAINILNNEDPALNFSYAKEKQELHITIRGKVQEEILQSIIKDRFGIEVSFSEPSVIYKETVTKTVEGYVRYWLPKPCWAIMKFKIEPAERGTGVQYSSIVSVNDIKKQYQNDVQKAIPFALKQGILGWQVDDVKITLIEGEDHEAHTKSNDFTIATPMGIMDGLSKSEPILLEPIFSFKIMAPEEYLGVIASELHKIRAEIKTHSIENGRCKLLGDVPLSTSIDFPIRLSSITSGKAKIITNFSSYQTCDIALGKTREYEGISPLDTAKYILKARKALG